MLKYLETRAEGKQLIYSHALDPHYPYDRGTKQGSSFERYVAEVALVDAAIGKLRAGIRRLHLENRTYLIVSSDHGEAFGEHGRDFHASTLYDEMVRIPLLIEGPGITPRVVSEPISLLDLSATLLDLFEVDVPGHFMGKSLVPFMRGDSPTLFRPIAIESERGMRAIIFPDGMKALVNVRRGTRELYDLRVDPGEHINLSGLPMANVYFADLAAWFRTLKLPAVTSGER